MSALRPNPFVRFYQALTPLGRWPRWLLIGILLYSVAAMLAISAYTAIVQPSGKALDAAIDNFLALWAVIVIPCAILMLVVLFWRSPLRHNWSLRLIGIGAIGIFATMLWLIFSLNTIVTLPRPPVAGLGLVGAACADVFFLGLILVTLQTRQRTWTTYFLVAFMFTVAVTWSYQELASAEPGVVVPVLYQLASGFQTIAYPLGILLVVAVSVQTVRAQGSRMQPPPAS